MNLLIKKLTTFLIPRSLKKLPLVQFIYVPKNECDKTELFKQDDSNAKLLEKKFSSSSIQSSFMKLIINSFVKPLRSTEDQELYQSHSRIGTINEALVYNTIIPLLNIYQDTPIPVPFCFVANYKHIILENLGETNYKHFDLKKGFITIQECISTLQALAKFHAATMVLKHKNGTDSEIVKMLTKNTLYNCTDSALLKCQQDRLQNILSIYNSRKPSEENATKIEALKYLIKVAKNDFKDLLSNEQDKFVFCHGNLLPTNFLYTKPIEIQNEMNCEIEALDIKFVDLKKVLYSSVANDLVYLLFINLNPDDYIAYKPVLLCNYFYSLIKYTEECGMYDEKLTFKWLEAEIDRFTEYGIINALWFIPILDGDNSGDTREVTNEILDENSKKVILNQRMEKWVDYYSKLFKKKSENNYL